MDGYVETQSFVALNNAVLCCAAAFCCFAYCNTVLWQGHWQLFANHWRIKHLQKNRSRQFPPTIPPHARAGDFLGVGQPAHRIHAPRSCTHPNGLNVHHSGVASAPCPRRPRRRRRLSRRLPPPRGRPPGRWPPRPRRARRRRRGGGGKRVRRRRTGRNRAPLKGRLADCCLKLRNMELPMGTASDKPCCVFHTGMTIHEDVGRVAFLSKAYFPQAETLCHSSKLLCGGRSLLQIWAYSS